MPHPPSSILHPILNFLDSAADTRYLLIRPKPAPSDLVPLKNYLKAMADKKKAAGALESVTDYVEEKEIAGDQNVDVAGLTSLDLKGDIG